MQNAVSDFSGIYVFSSQNNWAQMNTASIGMIKLHLSEKSCYMETPGHDHDLTSNMYSIVSDCQ